MLRASSRLISSGPRTRAKASESCARGSVFIAGAEMGSIGGDTRRGERRLVLDVAPSVAPAGSPDFRRGVGFLQAQSSIRAREFRRAAQLLAELRFGAYPMNAGASLGPPLILPNLVCALLYPCHQIGIDHHNLLRPTP